MTTNPTSSKALTRWADFTREEVHDLLALAAGFIPQRGQWGLQGIAPIKDRPGDFVFFVTFGQSQGEHDFDEGVTDEGVLSWQSQPKQALSNPQVKQFIGHDDLTNTIYLLLRTGREGHTRTSVGSSTSHMTPRGRTPSTFNGKSSTGTLPLACLSASA